MPLESQALSRQYYYNMDIIENMCTPSQEESYVLNIAGWKTREGAVCSIARHSRNVCCSLVLYGDMQQGVACTTAKPGMTVQQVGAVIAICCLQYRYCQQKH